MDANNQTGEQILWQGSQSQVVNFGAYLLLTILFISFVAGLILTVPRYSAIALVILLPMVWKWMKTKSVYYTITTQRIKTEQGIFSKRTENLELYRVKDISLDQPFFLRIFGMGNIFLETNDATTPILILHAVPKAAALEEALRNSIENRRQVLGVREIEPLNP
jgi:uncharacterized membrane protein YdbT with pleckstrin-like domain